MRKGDPRLKVGKRGPDKTKRKKKRIRPGWAKRGWAVNRRKKIPLHRHKPEGTQEEMTLAYNQARGYQLVVLNYCDKEELPEEVLAQQRRLFHFAKNGPNANKFIAYGDGKLLQADVLYILSCKVPAAKLAKLFKVGVDTIKDIRQGNRPEWQDEYDLVRRLRKAVISRFKKNFTDVHITVLLDSEGKVVQHFSSIKKAKEFRRTWLIYNQKIPAKTVDSWIKTKQIDTIYPIEETTVIS